MGEWRDETDMEVLEALTLYAQYGQTKGMSDDLDLPALIAGFEIEGIPQPDRAPITRMIKKIHSVRVSIEERRRKLAKGASGG